MRQSSKVVLVLMLLIAVAMSGCVEASVDVQNPLNLPENQRTGEQNGIIHKNVEESKLGNVQIISVIGMTGQIMFTDNVDGKVISSNKRLYPATLGWSYYIDTMLGSSPTNEMPGLDKTYGSSTEYLYYWNTEGEYTKIYPGSNLVIISSRAVSPSSNTFVTEKA